MDDLIAQLTLKAKQAAEQAAAQYRLPIAKPTQASVDSETETNDGTNYDDIIEELVDAAKAKQSLEQQKKKDKSTKFFNRPPEERITLQFVKELYQKTGITPAQSIYWFYEDRRSHPLIQQSFLDEETRKIGSPIGAMVMAKASQMPTFPEWVRDEPTHQWVLGRISQFLGFTSSYIQGFNSGFDGHAPGHRMCSYHFHCGYADGKVIYSFLLKEGLIVATDSTDPFREEDDLDALNELVRVKGYWRDDWGKKPKCLLDVTDLTQERLEELGLGSSIDLPSSI